MARDWSNINYDVLRLIANKLRILQDFIRLGAVCSSWMSVLVKQEGPIFDRTQLPSLLLPCDHEHPCQLQCHSRRIYNMMENKVYHFDFTEAYGKKCVGSSYGWLIMVEDISPAIFMLNPLTKHRIELPPVTTMPDVLGFSKEDVGEEYIVRSIFEGEIDRMGLKEIENFFTLKIILSNDPEEDDCIVVALCGVLRRLVFCRIGDDKWTQVEHNLKVRCPQNDVVYSGDKFYVVTCQATVGVFDVRNRQVTTILDSPSGINECDAMYLVVDTSGALLLISRHIVEILHSVSEEECDDVEPKDYLSSDHFILTKEFHIFKLDEEKNAWTKVTNIGENIIFLGENGSVCYSAIEFPECKGNSIYFSNGESLGGVYVYGGHDVGIFNVEDGSIEKIPCFTEDVPLRTYFPQPVWFTPSIRSSSRLK